MDFKTVKADSTTVTRDIRQFDKRTGNIYEAVVIMSRRANQIAIQMREELHEKLDDFSSHSDNLEEIFENREQIEVSKFYEKLPKPTLIAIQEFLDDKVHYRKTTEESTK